MTPSSAILSIEDLTVRIETPQRNKTVLEGLGLQVPRGETVALVGESGSGKTLAALSVLGLLPAAAHVTSGSIEFEETDLLTLSESEIQEIRGEKIGMVFQEPSTSLNPLMPIGRQIGEALRAHKGLGRGIVKEQVLSLMEIVGIPDPRRRYRSYPHQLSGGVRQRVVIAMALSCRPDLLLADEPTTSLDLTVQAQILDLLARLIGDLRMSVLLISHDLGVVANLADRIAVLHTGKLVEEGTVRAVLKTPAHPYTRALLNATPFTRRSAGTDQLVALSVSATGLEARSGCPMARTCRRAAGRCAEENPHMAPVGSDHRVRCHYPGEA